MQAMADLSIPIGSVSKRIPCSYSKCKDHRIHWSRPKKRGIQYVDVPVVYDGPAYCSLGCGILDGAFHMKAEKHE